MRMLPTLGALGILAGCGGRIYVPPTGGLDAYAKITIRNDSALPLTAQLYDDPLTCTGKVWLDAGGNPVAPGGIRSFYARKGEPVTIGAWYFQNFLFVYRRCDLNTTYVPRASSYLVVYDSDEEERRCAVLWQEGEGEAPRLVPMGRIAVRGFHRPFLEGGPWCQALSDGQRAALGLPGAPAAAAPAATPTTP